MNSTLLHCLFEFRNNIIFVLFKHINKSRDEINGKTK